MDSSWVPSMYLMPHWLKQLVEDYANEEPAEGVNNWPIKLLEKQGRMAVWNTSALLGVNCNGIPGQACRLLERYLTVHLREHIHLAIDNEEWDDFKRGLAGELPLLMASCVQLSAKMSRAVFQLNPAKVKITLARKGLEFTLTQIVDSELNVFKALGYKIPLWTSVEAAQLIAVELGLPSRMMERISLIVNLSEYRRDHLNAAICEISSTENASQLSTLHLIAGATAASARSYGFSGTDPTPKLATITRAPQNYIKCICDLILTEILSRNNDENSA